MVSPVSLFKVLLRGLKRWYLLKLKAVATPIDSVTVLPCLFKLTVYKMSHILCMQPWIAKVLLLTHGECCKYILM